MNFEFVTKFLECLADELGFIIVDASSRYAKAVYYVMFDEFDHIVCLHLL